MAEPKVDPREFMIGEAFGEAKVWLGKWEAHHGITPGELVMFHGQCLTSFARYEIRKEGDSRD